MIFFIGLLTVALVLDCVLLILLVLIQLPKKEAGAGVAFGGSATDALFGAGTGNVLTKATKWATIMFFALLLVISLSQNKVFKKDSSGFIKGVTEQSKASDSGLPAAPASAPAVSATPSTVSNLLTTTTANLTNAAKTTGTNSTPVAPK